MQVCEWNTQSLVCYQWTNAHICIKGIDITHRCLCNIEKLQAVVIFGCLLKSCSVVLKCLFCLPPFRCPCIKPGSDLPVECIGVQCLLAAGCGRPRWAACKKQCVRRGVGIRFSSSLFFASHSNYKPVLMTNVDFGCLLPKAVLLHFSFSVILFPVLFFFWIPDPS